MASRIPIVERLERRALLSADGMTGGAAAGGIGEALDDCVVAATQAQLQSGDCSQIKLGDQTRVQDQTQSGDQVADQQQDRAQRQLSRPPARPPFGVQIQARDRDCLVTPATPAASPVETVAATEADSVAALAGDAVTPFALGGALGGDQLRERDRDCDAASDPALDQDQTRLRIQDPDCEPIQERDQQRDGTEVLDGDPSTTGDQTRDRDRLQADDPLHVRDRDRIRDVAFDCLVGS